jgi:hypothetical protein
VRYVATQQEIAERYPDGWEIIRPSEICEVNPDARYFTPHRSPLDTAIRRYNERPPELQPAIDTAEAFLLAVFLRRYVTYCARRQQFAAMNGAARLLRDLKLVAE